MQLEISHKEIENFCRRWSITELALFGSALRNDFRSDSDIDILVTFPPKTPHSLFDLADMQEELKSILGRDVDLVERASLRNPFRRQHILQNMEIIYAA